MQQLPTAWAVEGRGYPLDLHKHTKPHLVIGPGAYIHPMILAREIQMVNDALGEDIRSRLSVDYRCGYHSELHTERSLQSGRHHSMGATGKGCSEAVIDKIRGRGKGGIGLFTDWLNSMHGAQLPAEQAWMVGMLQGLDICDTSLRLNNAWDSGATLLVEGTQGTLLDLHLGPHPFTTHKQTQVGSWLAEAGLSASLPIEVALVARTYPIRVAGNSGPLPQEIGWPELARTINLRLSRAGRPPIVAEEALLEFEQQCFKVGDAWWRSNRCTHNHEDGPEALWQIEKWEDWHRAECPEYVSELHREALAGCSAETKFELAKLFEMTTVTNKLRRVAELDRITLAYSVMLNRPAYLVMTFMNYLFPEAWDQDWDEMKDNSRSAIEDYCSSLGQEVGAEVRYISTGARTHHVMEVDA